MLCGFGGALLQHRVTRHFFAGALGTGARGLRMPPVASGSMQTGHASSHSLAGTGRPLSQPGSASHPRPGSAIRRRAPGVRRIGTLTHRRRPSWLQGSDATLAFFASIHPKFSDARGGMRKSLRDAWQGGRRAAPIFDRQPE
jgi:hypothetical protein